MSLQVKFLLLVGTLLLAVIGSVAAAGWSVRTVHREVATPFEQMSIALGELGKIKRAIEDIASAIGPALSPGLEDTSPGGVRDPVLSLAPRRATDVERLAVDSAAGRARAHFDEMERNDWYVSRIGVPTWGNIRNRLAAVIDGSRAWIEAGDERLRAGARREAFDLHELIERTELRLLEDARKAVGFSDQMRLRLGWLLAAVTFGAALVCVLGVVLLRRWVQRPVAELRQAAARIAAGDFSHRVAVATGDEIGQLMSEVNHMASMVDQYQREAIERERLAAVGQMVRRIVHNVRNPLAGIRGLAEITRLDTPEGSEHRDNLSLIVSTVDTFERWLTQLLETTRPMDLNVTRIALTPWVMEVLKAHESGAKTKSVSLVLDSSDAPTDAEFDPRHLEHALAAVLANAIDSSPRGGSVYVRASAAHDGDLVEISVQDQGPGVPAPLRERIFEPHFTTKAHGTGIGLAIARQILCSHGGRMTLDPAVNDESEARGACFRLSWPRIANRSKPPVVAADSHPGG
jgi:signal transduction histidine kinase